MMFENILHGDLKVINELVYEKCGLKLINLKVHSESTEYGACSFELNGKVIEYRTSKITPKKTGQFVTIWKRNKDGITVPYDIHDLIDFVIITSKNDKNIGQFIFPKTILIDKGILSKDGKTGKRGIRVYPKWDIATSKQALITQSWQMKYFYVIRDFTENFDLLNDLLKK